MDNPSPVIYAPKPSTVVPAPAGLDDTLQPCEVFDFIRRIKDPEHPYSLEELRIVREDDIFVTDTAGDHCSVLVVFYPTVPHCSLATTIGLCIRSKLQLCLSKPFKDQLEIRISEGTHSTAREVNKQINDKERVAAALENPSLRALVEVPALSIDQHLACRPIFPSFTGLQECIRSAE